MSRLNYRQLQQPYQILPFYNVPEYDQPHHVIKFQHHFGHAMPPHTIFQNHLHQRSRPACSKNPFQSSDVIPRQ